MYGYHVYCITQRTGEGEEEAGHREQPGGIRKALRNVSVELAQAF